MDKHSEVLLELKAVETWYGSLRALSDVSLTVSEGSITAVSYTHLTLPTKA